MTLPPTHEVTQLLKAWTAGDEQALEKLTPLVYEQLHRVAQRYMAGQRSDHTLQTTALVNEVYLRLVDCGQVRWRDRAHFFAVSARLMRRILVDFARSRGYQKRGGGIAPMSLDEAPSVCNEPDANRFAPETGQCLLVFGYFVGQELEGNKAAELHILSLVNDAHPAAAQLLDDAVVAQFKTDA